MKLRFIIMLCAVGMVGNAYASMRRLSGQVGSRSMSGLARSVAPAVGRRATATASVSSIPLGSVQRFEQDLQAWKASLKPDQQKALKNLWSEYGDLVEMFGSEPDTPETEQMMDQERARIHRLQENMEMLKSVPGYDSTLQSLGKKLDLKSIEQIEGFFNNMVHDAPELRVLQHVGDTIASSGLRPPVCSLSRPLSSNTLAYHDSNLKAIVVGSEWKELPPASQYHTLLHEYRHRLQDERGILDQDSSVVAAKKFYPQDVLNEAKMHGKVVWHAHDQKTWKPYEYDAERFATKECTCPTCLKVVQVQAPVYQSPEGYFGASDFDPFIQAAHGNERCPAHTIIPGDDDHNQVVSELEQALEEFKKSPSLALQNKIIRLDKQSGTLLQHVPHLSTNLMRRMAARQEFHSMITAKTVKELDAREQMQKLDKDSRIGRYRLITE